MNVVLVLGSLSGSLIGFIVASLVRPPYPFFQVYNNTNFQPLRFDFWCSDWRSHATLYGFSLMVFWLIFLGFAVYSVLLMLG